MKSPYRYRSLGVDGGIYEARVNRDPVLGEKVDIDTVLPSGKTYPLRNILFVGEDSGEKGVLFREAADGQGGEASEGKAR